MNLEKIFYLVASTVLVTVFVLIVFIFSPVSYEENMTAREKVIYYADNISPVMKKIIARFNDENRGKIRVETIDLPFEKFSTNERKELLARYLRSKSNRIDVFSVDIIWVPRFSRWARPLNALIDSSTVGSIIPHFLPTSYYKDSLVAIPHYIDIALMFYRDDLLKKVPGYEQYERELAGSITWERFAELRSAVDAANNRVNKPFYIFQAEAYEGLMCSFVEVMSNLHNPVVVEQGRLGKDDAKTTAAIEFITDLVHRKRLSPPEVAGMKENQSYEFFFANDGFAVRGWPGFMGKTNTSFRDEFRGKVKAAPLPHLNGSKPAQVFGGWNLMISNLSVNVPEAIKFVEFLLSDEIQKLHYEEGNILPVKRSVYADAAFVAKHPELSFYEKLFEAGVYRPMFENYTLVSDLIVQYLNRAIRENMAPAAVLEEINAHFRGN